ncbi:hypothetical protein, partial [Streptomyces sp. NPDC002491]
MKSVRIREAVVRTDYGVDEQARSDRTATVFAAAGGEPSTAITVTSTSSARRRARPMEPGDGRTAHARLA